ncbi:helix-turn-helix transcriptional regulator [Bradyrhizobium sp. BR13661]|jgi:transcriptional regulator with XRE-family HTH domain|uniref:helix-turn-helix domain-containing protein n=1 Tax=Bradyrhizobium sp. BR13661 TaxID=2940622 RepID=UPI00247350E9|nr:helix-turn-helix transcriptional regulator [Bradyrhizobium sp. BR13661]MDH6259685.1 transcriptional regulator with XRE-family HTH domain [Bradyrhizobium sp. BR13661]
MEQINPFILKSLRHQKGWSQDRLAEMSGVNKQTISRIERGGKDTRDHTIRQLAQALGVIPAELTRKTLPSEDSQTEPARRRPKSRFRVSDTAGNYLYLISERYFIKPWQVLELAPLLFCWAAEMSLGERRTKIKKLEDACSAARAVEREMRHLPPSNLMYSEEKITAETRSIEANDIFGMCFGDDDFSDGSLHNQGDDEDNPFAVFLSKLTAEIGDVATFEGFSPIDYPIFEVCRKEALDMVGGDEVLAERILSGIVDLYEMPKELQDFAGKTEDRAAWVQAQADAFIKEQLKAIERRNKTKEAAP